MSTETEQWLIDVVLVVLTLIVLVCSRGHSVEHGDSNDAPPASLNSKD